jgi:single-strand DNA-binding protein
MTYQQITLVGNVGRDPELRFTSSGIAVTDFSLAVNRVWTDQSGQKQERVTWWRVTCWRRQAEVVAQYVKKGKQVLVTASQIEADAYMGRDGEPRASLNITADEVRFLSGVNDSIGEPSDMDGQRQSGSRGQSVDAASGEYPQDNDFSAPEGADDIPF